MKSLFFYGTLRHLPLLELVLGRKADQIDAAPARLVDFAVSSVAEGPFPMIGREGGAIAEGLVVRGLSEEDVARLNFYEGSFDYDLAEVTLESGEKAEVYLPTPGAWTAAGPWSLADWIADWGEMSLAAAAEVMGYFGTRSRDEVAAMFPMIRARAASTVRAARSRHGSDSFQGEIEVQSRERAYAKFYALDDLELRHARFGGGMTPVLERAVLVGADAALVLPYDPVRDRVLLVEQIRLGPIARGDRACWQLEPIAGRIDPGETPEEAARREAIEEAGLTLSTLETIAEVYPSPGTSTEFYYLFLGLADLPDDSAGTGGLEAEGEDIKSHLMSFDALMARVGAIDVANAPLALAAYYLSHHRERLRSAGAGVTPGQ